MSNALSTAVAALLLCGCDILVPYTSRVTAREGGAAVTLDAPKATDGSADGQQPEADLAGSPDARAGDGARVADGADRVADGANRVADGAAADVNARQDRGVATDARARYDLAPPRDLWSKPDASLPADLALPPDHWVVAVDTLVAPDLGVSDTFIPTNACSGSALVEPVAAWTPGKMVVCSNTSGSGLDQCNAAKMCNASAGWQLCTATQYRARGGTLAGATTEAWLQSCIRSGGAPYSPSDTTCMAKCTTQSLGTFAEIEWTCAGIFSNANSIPYVGVTSSATGCRRLGTNSAGSAGWWKQQQPTSKVYGAVCCHP